MAKLSIVAGATSQSVTVFIQNSSSSTGAGLTGLVFNTSGLIAYYAFNGANGGSNVIALATLAAANSAYSSGGFKEIDSTNMPGLYRLDIPNAAIATSKGRSSVIMLSGAANMVPLLMEIELTGWDNQNSVNGGITALPNTACTTNASLLTSGTGTDQLSVASGVASANATKFGGQTVSAAGTVTVPGTIASPTNITAGTIATVSGNVNGNVAGSVGSVTGAVGSVTGAVGSVTGNVGGNVVGSVGSVVATVAANLTQILGTALTETAGQIAAAFKQFFNIASPTSTMNIITTVTNLTNAPTAGDFTSTMKASLNSSTPASITGAVGSVTGNVGGNVVGTVASVVGAVGSVTGNIGGNVVGSVGSVIATVAANLTQILGTALTETAGQLAAAFKQFFNISSPTSTMNTITNVTNLTNAPTAGDFTSTMKTSLNAATPASVVGAVGSVTGNVGGSVGSVVGLTASNLDTTVSSRLATSGYTAPNNSGITAIEAQTNLLQFDGSNFVKANTEVATSQINVKANTALNNFEFIMTDSTSHNPVAGLTVTTTVSINGAAPVASTNSASSVGSGIYKINLAAADLNGSVITLCFTATAADTRFVTIVTQA